MGLDAFYVVHERPRILFNQRQVLQERLFRFNRERASVFERRRRTVIRNAGAEHAIENQPLITHA